MPQEQEPSEQDDSLTEAASLAETALITEAASFAEHAPLTQGSLLGEGRFSILELIESGATADVYKARHLLLESDVALKILKVDRLSKQNSLERFQKEAKALSSISHPNIARIIGSGTLEKQGRPYLALEYVQGETLARLIARNGKLKSERAVQIAIQICDGLEALHEKGFIHRDLKPDNVMIEENDHVKIVDFGLVKNLLSDEQKLTRTGQVLGTAAYMSPEQCRSGTLDARSEVYSLACILYECLAGKAPFAGDNSFIVMERQLKDNVAPLDQSMEVLPGLEQVILMSLQKDPVNRQQSILELKTQLSQCLSGEVSGRFLTKSKTYASARTLWIAVAAVIIFLGSIGSFVLVARQNVANKEAKTRVDSAAKTKEDAKKVARVMARKDRLLDVGEIEERFAEAQVRTIYLTEWLEFHPHASLFDQGVAEAMLAEAFAKENLVAARAHAEKAHRLLRAQVSKLSDPAQYNLHRDSKRNLDLLGLLLYKLVNLVSSPQALIETQKRTADILKSHITDNGSTYLRSVFYLCQLLRVQGRAADEEVVLRKVDVSNLGDVQKIALLKERIRFDRRLKKDSSAKVFEKKWLEELEASDLDLDEKAEALISLGQEEIGWSNFETAVEFGKKALDYSYEGATDRKYHAATIVASGFQNWGKPRLANRYFAIATDEKNIPDNRGFDAGLQDNFHAYFISLLLTGDLSQAEKVIENFLAMAKKYKQLNQRVLMNAQSMRLHIATRRGDSASVAHLTRTLRSIPAEKNKELEKSVRAEFGIADDFYDRKDYVNWKIVLEDFFRRCELLSDKPDEFYLARLRLALRANDEDNPAEARRQLAAIYKLPFSSKALDAKNQLRRVIVGLRTATKLNDFTNCQDYIDAGEALIPKTSNQLGFDYLSAKASNCLKKKDFALARETGEQMLVLARVLNKSDYPMLSAQLVIAECYLAGKQYEKAEKLAREILETTKGRSFEPAFKKTVNDLYVSAHSAFSASPNSGGK